MGFNAMEKAKLLVVNSNADENCSAVLSDSGYEVSQANTPEDTMFTVLEMDPEIVIWSESLDNRTEWQRVKSILEARKPLLSIAKNWSKDAEEGSPVYDTNETMESIGSPVVSFTGLLARIESLEMGRAGTHHFYTKVGNKLRRINLSDIRFIQVEGKYSAIQLESRQYHVKASLKDLLVILASDDFVRVSRNFVINLNHIDHIDVYQGTVHVAGTDVPVSRTYKENLMKNVRLL